MHSVGAWEKYIHQIYVPTHTLNFIRESSNNLGNTTATTTIYGTCQKVYRNHFHYLCHLQQPTTVKGVNSSQSSVALLVVTGYRRMTFALAAICPDTHTYSTGRLPSCHVHGSKAIDHVSVLHRWSSEHSIGAPQTMFCFYFCYSWGVYPNGG